MDERERKHLPEIDVNNHFFQIATKRSTVCLRTWVCSMIFCFYVFVCFLRVFCCCYFSTFDSLFLVFCILLFVYPFVCKLFYVGLFLVLSVCCLSHSELHCVELRLGRVKKLQLRIAQCAKGGPSMAKISEKITVSHRDTKSSCQS